MTRRFFRLLLASCVTLVLAGVATAAAPTGDPVDSNFRDELVANLTSPIALAFTPDGRLLITTQAGTLRVYQNGGLLPTPALDHTAVTCSDVERGMLGLAIDPQFSANHRVYVYYTRKKTNTCVNRVSRFVLGDNNQVDPASETILIDDIPSPGKNHNAGDLKFGPDGKLYISIGDGGTDYAGDSGSGGNNDASRDRFILLGKILRINPDGSIPSDNPFLGTNSARCNVNARTSPDKICQETFAWGFRNPFRIAFDQNAAPGQKRLFVNDVGQNAYEEIDDVQAGRDYGWNLCEGTHKNGSADACTSGELPIYDYPHQNSCNSITGGAFVPNGLWPASYDGAYLFSDHICGKIFVLKQNSQGQYTRSDFVENMGSNSAVSLTFGPYGGSQALFYTSYATGQVRRISYQSAATNRPPIAVASATPLYGDTPLTVNFSSSGSSDPDGDTLGYQWNFGDSATSTQANPSHVYTTKGRYTATLTVRDPLGLSATASVVINAGGPHPQIVAPTTTDTFRVGQTIRLEAAATDANGQPLNDGDVSYTWEVRLIHRANLPGAHYHPYFGPATGKIQTIIGPTPEDLDAASNSYLELRLTATDKNGVAGLIVQPLNPHKVNMTFKTKPSGLKLYVNGTTFQASKTIVSWEGYALKIAAPTQATANGWLSFESWSNGGALQQTIVTSASPITLTATFTETRVVLLPSVFR